MLEQLSSEVSPFVFALLLKYKYLVLFPILVVEGPIATVLAGALASSEVNFFNIIPLFFFVVFADVAGDTIYYLIGRFAGEKVLMRISKKRHINYYKKITGYFAKYGGRTLMVAKISHGLGWPVMVFAGSIRMNYKRFITFCFTTSLVKSAVLLGIGYLYSENYKQIVSYFGTAGTIATTIIISSVIIYAFTHSKLTNE